MAARVGHDRTVETESPGASEGMIDRGDHTIFHDPDESVSSRWLRTGMVPIEPKVRWLVTSAVPDDPLVETVPRSWVVLVSPRSLASWRLTATKSFGGCETKLAMAA
jgi:hypothetical protein